MAFWGVEIKPGKPYTHTSDQSTATPRLRISQATLGAVVGKAGKQEPKTTVQCNVGKKSPVLICSLFADKCETCHLELEFEEQDDVVFSVLGQRTVHLSGYYLPDSDDGIVEPYGEDIADTESDDSDYDQLSDEDDDYESDFIDDSDDIDMYDGAGAADAYRPSRSRKSGVIIEEILEEQVPANGDKSHRLAKKKSRQVSDSDDGAGDPQHQLALAVVPASSAQLDSEDEDGFPISDSNKTQQKDENKKRKIDDSSPIADDKADKKKKKKKKLDKKSKKKEKGEKGSLSGVYADDIAKDKAPIDSKKAEESRGKVTKGDAAAAEKEKAVSEKMSESENGHTGDDSVEKESKKKKKKKNKKSGEKDEGNKEEKDEAQQSRTFGNGLIVEEISMGRPDGKKATPGSKVSVNYIGKLKNGKIFDSNVGQRPFKFRLGVGQVIKGWDVGVGGMRVGDKRRLTIPPAMGYGDKAMGKIPKNSWLIFDVELVNVQ